MCKLGVWALGASMLGLKVIEFRKSEFSDLWLNRDRSFLFYLRLDPFYLRLASRF